MNTVSGKRRNYQFTDLVDVAELQRLTDDLYTATGIPSAIITTEGAILTGSGWQRVCTQFHRLNPQVELECIESDISIKERIDEGEEFVIYTCPRGLTDACSPVIIDGEHMANVFAGQLFMELPDEKTEEFFRESARKYGFDEEAYIEAYREIPFLPENRFRPALQFLSRFAKLVANLGLIRLRELDALEELRKFEHVFQQAGWGMVITNPETQEIVTANPAFAEMHGYTVAEMTGQSLAITFAPEDRVRLPELAKAANEQGHLVYESVHIRKNGSIFPCVTSVTAYKDETGRVLFRAATCEDVSQRKQAEEKLLNSEAGLNEAQRVGRLGSWDWDVATDTITWSKEYYRIYGIDPAQSPPGFEEHLKAYTPESAARLDAAVKISMESGLPYELDLELAQTAGPRRWITARCEIKHDAGGQIVGLRGTAQDITERKQAEEAMRQSETDLRQAQRVANVGSWVWHIQSNRLDWSDQMYAIFGIDRESFSGDLAEIIALAIHPDDRAPVEQSNLSVIRDMASVPLEYRVIWPDGSVRTVWAEAGELILDDAGSPAVLTGIVQDITERKQAEEALRISEERFRHVTESAGEWVWEADTAGLYTYSSPVVESILGYKPEELVGKKHFFDMWPEEGKEELKRAAFDVFARKQTFLSFLNTNVRKDGQTVVLSTSGFPLLAPDGQVLGYRGADTDITKQVQAEKALRESEQRYRTIVTTTTDGIWIADRSAIILDVNEAYCKLTGFTREEIVGKHISEFELNEDAQDIAARNERIIRTGADLFETRHRTKAGGAIDLEISVTHAPGERGEFFGFIRDINQRKRLEREQRQVQKIEALGTMAGGIAHDFNNLLFAILGNAELINDMLEPGSHEHENMARLIEAGKRAKDLVKQILAFSRKADSRREPINLQNIVIEALHILRRAIPSSIEIKQLAEPVGKYVIADPTEFHQVLMNLCMNSAQAMEPEPGVLTVSLRETEVSSEEAAAKSGLAPGSYLELIVSDTGCGIPAHILPNIFDPYFTTKEQGRGTGLGLSVVHGILTQLKGYIWYDSQPGEGTRATVLLPAVAPEAQVADSGSTERPRLSGHILVVDDETDNLRIMKQMLAGLGCTCQCCNVPGQALELLSVQPKAFSAVITDQTMPSLKGTQLARLIRDVGLKLPIILYTGFGDSIGSETLDEAGVNLLLSKPLTTLALGQALQQALQPPSAE